MMVRDGAARPGQNRFGLVAPVIQQRRFVVAIGAHDRPGANALCDGARLLAERSPAERAVVDIAIAEARYVEPRRDRVSYKKYELGPDADAEAQPQPLPGFAADQDGGHDNDPGYESG